MSRIFISYRQSETQGVARKLCDALRRHYGEQVFMNLAQVPLGSDFRQVVAQEVERSDLVLVLIGSRWLEIVRSKATQSQDFVRTEIEIALARNILTVPVLLGEDAAMPQEEELPPRIGRLAYLQAFRLIPEQDFEGQMQRLIAGLDHALALRSGAGGTPAAAVPRQPASLKKAPIPRERRIECLGLDLRWVEPGHFHMGSPLDETGRWRDEGPSHEVNLPVGFWLGVVPVTQQQYSQIMEVNPSFFQGAGGHAPVESVDWLEAQAFCLRLREKEPPPAGFEYRLPTEAEWEYACRAGTQAALFSGPLTVQGTYCASELDAIAWYGGNSGVDYPGGVDSSSWFEKQFEHRTAGTHPVAQKEPNPWGFYDMLGNVWEWCLDGKRVYRQEPAEQPLGPLENVPRVIRGGSWEDRPGDCRCATRFAAGEKHRYPYLGFRLAMAPVRGEREKKGKKP